MAKKKGEPKKTVEKEVKGLDRKIEKLKQAKTQLVKEKAIQYCPVCKEYYPLSKIKSEPRFEEAHGPGGDFLWFDDFEMTCPKGHVFSAERYGGEPHGASEGRIKRGKRAPKKG